MRASEPREVVMKVHSDSKVWTIELTIDESADVTEAKALLLVNDTSLADGGARRHPRIPIALISARSSRQPARSPIFPVNSSMLPRPRSRSLKVTV